MAQIGLAIIGVALIVIGIRALAGKETEAKKTSPATAIACLVFGALIVLFAFVGLPIVIRML